jgi:15-cis-phytoene synthase
LLQQRREETLVEEARTTTRRVSRTFAIACRLLPRSVRDDVYLLYMVFRTLDDLVDFGEPGAEERVALVEAWCRGGAPASREARVLARLDARYGLPREALLEFCRGMRDDLEAVPILTEADLDRYCYRVAGTVGLTMTALLGMREPAEREAAALGMAMQRTNILRDIDEDRANGRVYIAAETLQRYGLPDPGRREPLIRDQIERADALYEVGVSGIPKLLHGRRAVACAAAMYREILRQIERDGYGACAGRAVVPRTRKLLVAARARVA